MGSPGSTPAREESCSVLPGRDPVPGAPGCLSVPLLDSLPWTVAVAVSEDAGVWHSAQAGQRKPLTGGVGSTPPRSPRAQSSVWCMHQAPWKELWTVDDPGQGFLQGRCQGYLEDGQEKPPHSGGQQAHVTSGWKHISVNHTGAVVPGPRQAGVSRRRPPPSRASTQPGPSHLMGTLA